MTKLLLFNYYVYVVTSYCGCLMTLYRKALKVIASQTTDKSEE